MAARPVSVQPIGREPVRPGCTPRMATARMVAYPPTPHSATGIPRNQAYSDA
jgi:hypothetical protein